MAPSAHLPAWYANATNSVSSRHIRVLIPAILILLGGAALLRGHIENGYHSLRNNYAYEQDDSWPAKLADVPPPPPGQLPHGIGSSHNPHTGYLPQLLEYQEDRYQDYVRRRGELIRKWGPRIEDIPAFPEPNGKFYVLWDFLIPAFTCPFSVQRVGQLGDGGKWVCGTDRVIHQENCVIYSFGVEGESTFEAEVLHRSKTCQIYGYDYSVDKWGPEVANIPSYAPRVHFHKTKISTYDRPATAKDPEESSIRSIFDRNGHKFVDILKVDIEGAEYDALKAFIASYEGKPLPFGQLQIEIHVWGKSTKFMLEFWEMLESAGLRAFWTEVNLPAANQRIPPDVSEFSFINIRGNHALVSDTPDSR